MELKRIVGPYLSYSKIGSKEDLEKYLLRDDGIHFFLAEVLNCGLKHPMLIVERKFHS